MRELGGEERAIIRRGGSRRTRTHIYTHTRTNTDIHTIIILHAIYNIMEACVVCKIYIYIYIYI